VELDFPAPWPIKIHGLFPRARLELAPLDKSTYRLASGACRCTSGDQIYNRLEDLSREFELDATEEPDLVSYLYYY